jgi:hypothetical protein
MRGVEREGVKPERHPAEHTRGFLRIGADRQRVSHGALGVGELRKLGEHVHGHNSNIVAEVPMRRERRQPLGGPG